MLENLHRRRARKIAHALPDDVGARVFVDIFGRDDRSRWDKLIGVELALELADRMHAAGRPAMEAYWRARADMLSRDVHLRYLVAGVSKLDDVDVATINLLNELGDLVVAADAEGAEER